MKTLLTTLLFFTYFLSHAQQDTYTISLDGKMVTINAKTGLPVGGAVNNNTNINATSTKSYIVKAGDTYYAIAKANNISLEKLIEINNITKHSVLTIGESLLLQDSIVYDKTITTNNTTPVNANASYHVVTRKQTLYAISKMYNTTVEKLQALNGLTNNLITIGQKLRVK